MGNDRTRERGIREGRMTLRSFALHSFLRTFRFLHSLTDILNGNGIAGQSGNAGYILLTFHGVSSHLVCASELP